MEFDQLYGFSSPKKRSNKELTRQYGTIIAEPDNEFEISNVQIGEGSFSTVYLAKNLHSGATVVAKVINKKVLDPKIYNNVMKEAKILESLHHKNIITIYHTEENEDTITFFMDYYPGGDIHSFSEEYEYLSECMAFTIISQLVEAVEYLHQHNVIHRDIKLENLLYDNETNMHIVLSDFGFSTIRAPDDPLLQNFPGSPAYAAPELMLGIPYTGYGSDIWAIGICLYVLVAGMYPFWSETKRIMFEKITKYTPKIPRHISPECANLILALLDKNPDRRPNIAEIKQSTWFRHWNHFFETQTCSD
jgi:serine/threonine protein kinase